MRSAAVRLIYFTINDGIKLFASSHPNFLEKRAQTFKKNTLVMGEIFNLDY